MTVSKGVLQEKEVGLGVAQSGRSNGEVNSQVPCQVQLTLACTQARVCTVERLLCGKEGELLRGPSVPSAGSR